MSNLQDLRDRLGRWREHYGRVNAEDLRDLSSTGTKGFAQRKAVEAGLRKIASDDVSQEVIDQVKEALPFETSQDPPAN